MVDRLSYAGRVHTGAQECIAPLGCYGRRSRVSATKLRIGHAIQFVSSVPPHPEGARLGHQFCILENLEVGYGVIVWDGLLVRFEGSKFEVQGFRSPRITNDAN